MAVTTCAARVTVQKGSGDWEVDHSPTAPLKTGSSSPRTASVPVTQAEAKMHASSIKRWVMLFLARKEAPQPLFLSPSVEFVGSEVVGERLDSERPTFRKMPLSSEVTEMTKVALQKMEKVPISDLEAQIAAQCREWAVWHGFAVRDLK